MASVIFDGARAFEGVTPDLDLHCARTVASAISFGLKPIVPAGEILEIAREGVAKFGSDAELYIRPMMWAEEGFVAPDPESTRFCLSVFEAPMPQPKGMSVQLSSCRRPLASMAPTQAKAACLYPNSGRALREALDNGFDNAVMLDGLGNVAELATSNLWIAKDGAAHTPAPNGTFLNGITRQRVIKLLRDAGIPVYERCITWAEVMDADEAFSTGNYSKVVPITKIADRNLQMGPIYHKARELYWNWSHCG
jgi:branched-chain amino acid aminotransferase